MSSSPPPQMHLPLQMPTFYPELQTRMVNRTATPPVSPRSQTARAPRCPQTCLSARDLHPCTAPPSPCIALRAAFLGSRGLFSPCMAPILPSSESYRATFQKDATSVPSYCSSLPLLPHGLVTHPSSGTEPTPPASLQPMLHEQPEGVMCDPSRRRQTVGGFTSHSERFTGPGLPSHLHRWGN